MDKQFSVGISGQGY